MINYFYTFSIYNIAGCQDNGKYYGGRCVLKCAHSINEDRMCDQCGLMKENDLGPIIGNLG
jgi:hypothetical protein